METLFKEFVEKKVQNIFYEAKIEELKTVVARNISLYDREENRQAKELARQELESVVYKASKNELDLYYLEEVIFSKRYRKKAFPKKKA